MDYKTAYKRIAAKLAAKIETDMVSQLVATGATVTATSTVNDDSITIEKINKIMADLPPILKRIECREDEYAALKFAFLAQRPDPHKFIMDAVEVRIWDDEKLELLPGVGVAVFSNGKREAVRVLASATCDDIWRIEKELNPIHRTLCLRDHFDLCRGGLGSDAPKT